MAITSDRFRSNFGSAYTMAIQIMMIEVHRDLWARKRTHESANFLLEEGPHIYQAMDLLENKNKDNPEAFVKINSVGKGSKQGNPILQAADLLAFGWGEYLKKKRSTMLSKIAAHRPRRFPIITWRKDMIEELVNGINADLESRRYFKSTPMRRGLKPLLKGPDYEDALSKRS
jgi:hypothetical protein